jgi:ornithine carbamoyltransferase
MNHLFGRSLLCLREYSALEIEYLLHLAERVKKEKQKGYRPLRLAGKNIVLLFEKPSTRTRCAFEVAAFDEGACVTTLNDSHMGEKESIKDTAKELGRFYDGIQFRGFAQSTVVSLAQHSGVPVWNGLTDDYHPTQILADLLTIRECTHKTWREIKLVYVGDARNNVAHTLLIAAAKLGIQFVALAPASLQPDPDLLAGLAEEAQHSGAQLSSTEDIATAVAGADIIYTDVWVSMGEEEQLAERLKLLLPYQVNAAMLEATGNSNVIFLHCLPSWHDTHTQIGKKLHEKYGVSALEVTDEVFYSASSQVFLQAENRLHTIKALMLATLLPQI